MHIRRRIGLGVLRRFCYQALLASVVFSVLLPSAHGQNSSGKTFVFATREEPATLDPHSETNNPPKKVFEAVYEALLDYDPETLFLVPKLATSWQVAEDGLSIVFHLREGVTFHDGTAMNSQAVVYSFERLMGLGLGYAFLFTSIDSIEPLDDNTVRFNLSRLDPGLLDAFPLVYIVSPTSFSASTTGDEFARSWVATNAVGTGPYRLDHWIRNQQFELSSFQDYWGGWDHPHIDKYILRIVPESATQRQLVEAGAAQMADTIEFEDIDALARNPRLQVLEDESIRQFYLILNTTSGPLADIRARQAIASIFDPTVIADDVLLGHATVPRGPVPYRMPGANPEIEPTSQDLNRAAQLLREAGLVNAGVKLSYVYFAPYTWQRINGELLQATLAPFGITMTIEGLPFTTLTERAINPDTRPDIVAAAVAMPTTDPASLLNQFFHSASTVWSNNDFSDPEIDASLDQAAVTLDSQVRQELFNRVQELVMQDLPIIPFTILNDIKLESSAVKGYQFQPMRPAAVNWYGIYLED